MQPSLFPLRDKGGFCYFVSLPLNRNRVVIGLVSFIRPSGEAYGEAEKGRLLDFRDTFRPFLQKSL